MKVLIINGPNLNFLGKRDQKHYGTKTLDEINQMLHNCAKEFAGKPVQLVFLQSNHEGALIDFIQKHHNADGLLINPGALSHYSYSLSDALRDFPRKKVEVHLSDISKRESFRKRRVTAKVCDKVIIGKKEKGYLEGLRWLIKSISS